MNMEKIFFAKKTGLGMALAVAGLLASSPCAFATPVQIGFNGAGGSGHVSLTVESDSTAGDPAGAQVVTDANGTFSDTTLGLDHVAITGVLARNFATPNDTVPDPGDDPLPFPPVPFPASYSALSVLNPPGQDTAITYDDLFYPDGSPRTCWDYPFSGGFLDVYGVMFTLANGGFVDLWSDGVMSPGGLTYGFAVMLPNDDPAGNWVSDFQFNGVHAAVPEPDSVWMLGASLLGLLAWRRSVETRRRAARTG
ncbi:MAG TPA: PEP-CTERM sorting domain-containing protein [Rhodanobacteraceae bacterium]|nr:PEP-CTERM sorting domain-containing protein [Rhodanobacteraceae bacterium]